MKEKEAPGLDVIGVDTLCKLDELLMQRDQE